MTDLVSARQGTRDDLGVTTALALAEAETIRTERGGRWHLDHDAPRESTPSLHADALADTQACIVVGCIDDVVVGFARASLSSTTTGRLCMIDELIVHPNARAIGVGSEILAGVRDWAVTNECQAIESQVLPGNRAAKNFFERVGMKTRKMRVSADL